MIDKNKLIHWLNIRKTTFDELNKKLLRLINIEIEKDDLNKLDKNSINKISEILDVPNSFLMKSRICLLVFILHFFLFSCEDAIETFKINIIIIQRILLNSIKKNIITDIYFNNSIFFI